MPLETKEHLVRGGAGAAIRTAANCNVGTLDLRLVSQGNVRGAAKRAAQTRSHEPRAKTWRGNSTHRRELAVFRITEIHTTAPHPSDWPAPGRADFIGPRSAEDPAAAGYSVRIVQRHVGSAEGITE